MADENSKCILSIFKLIIFIGSLIILILNIVYLFGIINNCKDEPTDLDKYASENPELFYSGNDFCFDNYYLYIEKGAFETFNLRIKKIKTFSKALVSTLIISIGLLILSFVLIILAATACKYHEGFIAIFSIIFLLLTYINLILNVIFFIILCVHYFKSKFNDFKTFSECKYFTDEFKNDYQFVFNIQTSYTKILILWIVSFFLNIIDNLIKFVSKKK